MDTRYKLAKTLAKTTEDYATDMPNLSVDEAIRLAVRHHEMTMSQAPSAELVSSFIDFEWIRNHAGDRI